MCLSLYYICPDKIIIIFRHNRPKMRGNFNRDFNRLTIGSGREHVIMYCLIHEIR